MGSARTLLAILCGAFAMASTVAALCTDCWQINSKGSVALSTRCRGLWRECVWDTFAKFWTCDVFGSYLNPHPAAVVLTRTLLITASIAGAGAFLCLLLGFQYFSCCEGPLAKQHCLRLAAGLSFFGGSGRCQDLPQHSVNRGSSLEVSPGGITKFSACVGALRYCVYVYSLHRHEVSLKIPGLPSSEYGYSLWLAVGGSLGALAAAGLACREVLCKRDPRANAMKGGAGSGGAVQTYV